MRRSNEQRKAMLDLIEQWQQSGISQKDFYHQHNIPAHVFYYWHKCYRKQRFGFNKPTSINGFIKLEPSPVPSSDIEIQLSNGNRIIFHQPVSVDYLKALIF
jgi:hypothetical protein